MMPLTVNFANIPFELQQYPYWCVWKYEKRPGEEKPGKVPYHPLTGRYASSNNPSTFVPFNTAKQALEGNAVYSGVGVGVFDSLAAVDIDGCIDPKTGEISDLARDVIFTMATYTEVSPSGSGFRLIFRAPGFQYDRKRYYINKKKVGLEVYVGGCTEKFLTITGNVFGFPLPIIDCSAALPLVLEKYMRRGNSTDSTTAEMPEARSLLSDAQVIEKASKREKFAQLYAGAWEALGYSSQSEADQAFCNLLAFWCGRDTEQMDRIFTGCGLYREKWGDRSDYRASTLEKAVRGCSTIYDPASEEYRHRQAMKDFADIVGIVPEGALINPLGDKESYRPSDRGNGFLFADLFADVLRYCPQAKGWYVYRGGQWQPDIGDAIARECAKSMPKYLCRFLPEIEDGGQREAFNKNMMQLYGLAARERMLKDAQSVNSLRLEDLDTNTDLLNVLNGTLNLNTGTANPHNAADLISKKTGVVFMPGADCPLWKKTLDEIFEGKSEIIRYFQKVLGYALLGKPVEKEFYVLYGRETDNGKSTITQTIEKLMGDYALNAPPELIAEKRFKDSSRPSGDRARLAGVRFLSINEPERGMRLDEAYVKAITGRDTQTARHLHQAEFQYSVQFIMLISTNHLPYVSDQTLFKSGRVRVIPFARRFEEHEKNKKLIDQLREPQELSGILNWVLEGLAAYHREGLTPPPAVAKEIKDYERISDNVMRFLEDCTEKDINGAVPMSTMYVTYQTWCAREGLSSMSLKAFSQALKERGCRVENGRHNGSIPISHVWDVKCAFSMFNAV